MRRRLQAAEGSCRRRSGQGAQTALGAWRPDQLWLPKPVRARLCGDRLQVARACLALRLAAGSAAARHGAHQPAKVLETYWELLGRALASAHAASVVRSTAVPLPPAARPEALFGEAVLTYPQCAVHPRHKLANPSAAVFRNPLPRALRRIASAAGRQLLLVPTRRMPRPRANRRCDPLIPSRVCGRLGGLPCTSPSLHRTPGRPAYLSATRRAISWRRAAHRRRGVCQRRTCPMISALRETYRSSARQAGALIGNRGTRGQGARRVGEAVLTTALARRANGGNAAPRRSVLLGRGVRPLMESVEADALDAPGRGDAREIAATAHARPRRREPLVSGCRAPNRVEELCDARRLRCVGRIVCRCWAGLDLKECYVCGIHLVCFSARRRRAGRRPGQSPALGGNAAAGFYGRQVHRQTTVAVATLWRGLAGGPTR